MIHLKQLPRYNFHSTDRLVAKLIIVRIMPSSDARTGASSCVKHFLNRTRSHHDENARAEHQEEGDQMMKSYDGWFAANTNPIVNRWLCQCSQSKANPVVHQHIHDELAWQWMRSFQTKSILIRFDSERAPSKRCWKLFCNGSRLKWALTPTSGSMRLDLKIYDEDLKWNVTSYFRYFLCYSKLTNFATLHKSTHMDLIVGHQK